MAVGSVIDRGGRGIRPHAGEGEGQLVLLAWTPVGAPVYHAVDAQDVDGFAQHRRQGELLERLRGVGLSHARRHVEVVLRRREPHEIFSG